MSREHLIIDRIEVIPIGVRRNLTHDQDRSGAVQKRHLSPQGPPLLRRALYEAVVHACRPSSPDYVYYQKVKARHQGDGEIAVLAVARKLARRCYRTLRELGPEVWPVAA